MACSEDLHYAPKVPLLTSAYFLRNIFFLNQ